MRCTAIGLLHPKLRTDIRLLRLLTSYDLLWGDLYIYGKKNID